MTLKDIPFTPYSPEQTGYILVEDMAEETVDMSRLSEKICEGTEGQLPPAGNMSLIRYKDGYLASVRLFQQSSLYADENRQYVVEKCRHPMTRFPVYAELDRSFRPVKIYKTGLQTSIFGRFVLEDARLVEWDGRIYSVSTCHGAAGGFVICDPRIEVQRVDLHGDSADSLHVFHSRQMFDEGYEKNWMPVEDMPFVFVRHATPYGVQAVNVRSFSVSGEKPEGRSFSGSSPLIKRGSLYVSLVHEKRNGLYVNRLCVYDRSLRVVRVSDPFKFTRYDIEFVPSMLIEGRDAVFCVTVADSFASVRRYDFERLLTAVFEKTLARERSAG